MAVAAAACATQAAEDPSATFLCEDVRVDVVFRSDSAFITMPDTALALPLAISASGARYSDGLATFWEHQGTARIEVGRDTFDACTPAAR